MSALKLSNPVIFRVGMVADNLSFHVNVIARARGRSYVCKRGRLKPPAPVLLWEGGGGFRPSNKELQASPSICLVTTGDSRTTFRLPGRSSFAWWLTPLDHDLTRGCVEHWIARGAAVPLTLRTRQFDPKLPFLVGPPTEGMRKIADIPRRRGDVSNRPVAPPWSKRFGFRNSKTRSDPGGGHRRTSNGRRQGPHGHLIG
jgi:hypothetical protein